MLAALGAGQDQGRASAALNVWDRLGEWSEHAPEPPPGNIAVDPGEARQRLAAMLGGNAEQRPSQADFASAAALAFAPRQLAGSPNLVLAEAGTGTGKTLGYVAPASFGPRKTGGRYGSVPIPATCSDSSTANSTASIPIRRSSSARW